MSVVLFSFPTRSKTLSLMYQDSSKPFLPLVQISQGPGSGETTFGFLIFTNFLWHKI